MILFNKEKNSSIELELQEIERDRATGIEVEIHLKNDRLQAGFFSLWIEKEDLAKFIQNLKRVVAGKARTAQLNSPTADELYLMVMRKDQSFFIGVRVEAYNFTPIKLKDSVTLSFEIDPESIPPFIEGLKDILAQF